MSGLENVPLLSTLGRMSEEQPPSAGDDLKEAARRVMTAADKMMDKAAASTAGKGLSDAVDKVADTLDPALSKLDPAINSAAKKTEELVTTVGKNIGPLADQLSDGIGKFTSRFFGGKGGEPKSEEE